LKKPSLPTVIITVLWVAYGSVTACVFYQAIEPVERDLVNILGGFGVLLLIGTGSLFLLQRRDVSRDKSQSRADQPDSAGQA
jgi:hypothetical protein